MRALDLKGQKFGRLLVLELAPAGGKRSRWSCLCDCGCECVALTESLRNGEKRSCGCLQKEILIKRNFKHGQVNSPEFQSWVGMIARCTNPSHVSYPRYGGRGISICKRWSEFKNFLDDMGQRPKGSTLDRIDNNAGYSPENCRWASYKEQARNKSANKLITFAGKTKCIAEWAAELGVPAARISRRLIMGWPVEKALMVKRYENYGKKVRLLPRGNNP